MYVSIPFYSYLMFGLILQHHPDNFTQKNFPIKSRIHCAMCPCMRIQSEFLGLINLMSPSTHEILLSIIISYLAHIAIFLSSLFDYWFQNRINLCTWSTQHVIVSQHAPCFFNTSYLPLFFSVTNFILIP